MFTWLEMKMLPGKWAATFPALITFATDRHCEFPTNEDIGV